MSLIRPIKPMINFNPEEDKLEDLIKRTNKAFGTYKIGITAES